MIESNLKYPGPLSHSQRLRRLTSICISAAEQAERVSPGSSTATTLKQFLEDAAAKCPGESSVPELPPTVAMVEDGDKKLVDVGGESYNVVAHVTDGVVSYTVEPI